MLLLLLYWSFLPSSSQSHTRLDLDSLSLYRTKNSSYLEIRMCTFSVFTTNHKKKSLLNNMGKGYDFTLDLSFGTKCGENILPHFVSNESPMWSRILPPYCLANSSFYSWPWKSAFAWSDCQFLQKKLGTSSNFFLSFSLLLLAACCWGRSLSRVIGGM